ncbi:acyltransferase domain-containing protein [Streptomyces sp. NPDC057654]|uniref:acyltransferase domain-containing protein n=1 Tax=Streptomyces sp. NPDC057654 TaxID=3346196 RepID=UPI0036B71C5F
MSRRTVHVFPGQGDFSPRVLARAARAHRTVGEALSETYSVTDEVGRGYGLPPLRDALLGTGPPSGADLAAAVPGTHQIALYGAQLTVHRALTAAGYAPHRVVGVSFGEIPALVAAGRLTTADGAHAAVRTARALLRHPGGMTLIAAPEKDTHRVLRAAGCPQVVRACTNEPDKVVITGPEGQLTRAEQHMARHGIGATRLRLPFMCHHPAMEATARELADALAPLPAQPGRLPVYSATHDRRYDEQDDVLRCFTRSLTHPFDLLRAAATADSGQPGLWLEAGTGTAVTDAVRRADPRRTAHAPLAEHLFP